MTESSRARGAAGAPVGGRAPDPAAREGAPARGGAPTAGPRARRALAVGGVVLAAACSTGVLTGCAAGKEVTPSNDEYAGRAQTANPAPAGGTTAPATTAPAPAPTVTGGPYADGQYAASESYGVVDGVIEEDSIDVTATLQGGVITDVSVTGHPLLTQSHDYMQGFVNEISGAVVGRSVEDAHVTALAGASKTSDAFNDAIDDIASQAARAAASGS